MECWSLREREREKEFKAHCNNYCSAVMERLQGPIDPCFFGELEQEFVTAESLKFEEEEANFSTPMLEDKMPFLQMLQSVGSPHFLPFKEPSFQTLLRLQHLKKPCEDYTYFPEMETQIQALELESCITHDIVELHSPMKSETMDLQHPHSTSCLDGMSSECNQEKPNSSEKHCIESNSAGSPPPWSTNPQQSWPNKQTHFSKSLPAVTRERRKRKRTRPTKNKEEVENQRMTHIAVERNRRRQMNDHLNVLRSLMPTSYIQRGDQASIIGGAIDFVKELEQLLHSLEAQKIMRKNKESGEGGSTVPALPSNGFFMLQQCRIGSAEGNCGEELKAENKSELAEIEVTVIQTHVNLKIHCQKRPGQLLKAIVALEDLRLTVLHLNITSSDTSVFYSFNLKMEDECKLGSADEIASKVHQIFSFINGS